MIRTALPAPFGFIVHVLSVVKSNVGLFSTCTSTPATATTLAASAAAIVTREVRNHCVTLILNPRFIPLSDLEPQTDRYREELAVRLFRVGAGHAGLHLRAPDVVIPRLEVEPHVFGEREVDAATEVHA